MEATKMNNYSTDHDEKATKDGEVMLPGFRFHPTDEELVGFYLRRKVEKRPISIEIIKQIDIYKYDPWDLPIGSVGDKEWYFFCMRGRKYKNSVRPNRVTKSGFWKATGIDKPIYSVKPLVKPEPICIGLKKSLVYYRGSAGKGTKSDWMMHEFRLPPNGKHFSNAKDVTQEAEVWTLCRIFKRTPSNKNYAAAAAWKLDATIKQNGVDSKTCSSLEEDSEISTEQCMSFHDSVQQNDCKPNLFIDQVDARNYFLLGGNYPWSSINSMAKEAPFAAINYPSLRNHANGVDVDVFSTGNWDELRPVVQLALEPYHCHSFDGT